MRVKQYETVFFALGIAAAGLLVYNLGWTTLVSNLSEIGWWFVPIAGVRFAVYAVDRIRPISSFFPHRILSIAPLGIDKGKKDPRLRFRNRG